jgi:selenide,water dikinase
MQADTTPIVKDLVLVGGGHSHVTVLKRFGMKPIPGVRITLICRDMHAPYSGMLPGFIAGHYDFDEAHIDLAPLARFANARFYHDEVIGIDHANRQVLCRTRPPVPFDVMSINIGSAPTTKHVSGATGNVVPVKPIDSFVDQWEGLRARVLDQKGQAQIGVVGAGAGGVELLLAVQYRLGQLLEISGHGTKDLVFHLFTDTSEILPTHNAHVRKKFERVLGERHVHVHYNEMVDHVEPGRLTTAGGDTYDLDEILWVTNAGAADWPSQCGLDVDEKGFIKVDDTLQSMSHENIFAAGDIASVVNHPRPKSGVFAVRQGKPLERNLRRALLGKILIPFTPQSKFLSLISTGDKYAVASRSFWTVEGYWVWRWKDWIDRRFMEKYNDLPEMNTDEGPSLARGLANDNVIKEISAIAMRCGGCGSKVGASALSRAINTLEPVTRDDVLIGLHAPDDAAVVEVPPGKVMVHTVDSFRTFINDPYVFGQVTANHALGDIYAMGGEPQTALAIAVVPFGLEDKVVSDLSQMLAGALAVFKEANTSLVGGHTSEGDELTLGFSLNGLVDRDRIMRKGGMQPGNKLIITKPVGTGTLFAADMRQKAKGRWIEAALASMVQSNLAGAKCLFEHNATACTDVTGFGLLGHLVEMAKPSGVDVELDLNAVPILDGALEMVQAGIFSSLQPQNIRLRRAVRNGEEAGKDPRYPLIFDPQTAGGLLASVPGELAESCVAALRKIGYPHTAIIGEITEQSDHLEPIIVKI